jgi:hypothetical protein
MDALDAFLDELRAAGSAVDAPAPSETLQVLFRDGTVPVAPAPLPRLRRRPLVRVALAGAGGAFAFGGLGVAGALPAPVQAKVADVADFVGVNLPDGNPGHGGEPPSAPPAGDAPSEHHDPGNVDEQHKSDNAPDQQGDDHDNGRHVGPDGSIPSTSVPEEHAHGGGGASTQTSEPHGQHRGWTNFPPSTFEIDTQGPPAGPQDNRGGNN